MIHLLVSIKQKIASDLKMPSIGTAFRQIENWAQDPSNGLMQPGDIISSVGSATTRPGFYLCDGTTYTVTNFNAALQKALGQTGTTLTVPNLINQFQRGGTTYGATGGANSATVTHHHSLSAGTAYSELVTGAGANATMMLNRVSVASWSPNIALTLTNGTTTTAAQTLGVGVTGNTDDASPVVATIPTYVTVQVWIKY